ncbi:MAG: von Willebrand factor type A domain-containing protein, partial [Steroidobacteraceae bacterium]|nr:von Willebrand factor type A domain-containing protein [Steroidobacteraceae bacterium]
MLWPFVSRNIDPTTLPEPPVELVGEAREVDLRSEPELERKPAATADDATAGSIEPALAAAAVSGDKARDTRTRQVAATEAGPPPANAVVVEPIVAKDVGRFPDASVVESIQRVPASEGQTSPGGEVENVVVTGHRAQLQSAFEVKRESASNAEGRAVVDAIHAEDIGKASKRSSGNPKVLANAAPAPTHRDARVQALIITAQPTTEDNDKFRHFEANPIKRVAQDPVSTFSVDVDTASYAFVRRALNSGSLPPPDSVRVEEMINYFDYAWPVPASRAVPFEPTIVVSDSPWSKGKKLVHVAIKGYEVPRDDAPDANLVLLLDVSGSMNSPDKLPLAVQSMELLLGSLKPTDTIGIVVYAGAAGMVLEPTPVREKAKILSALRSLTPGGSTAGAAGIELAYKLAEANFRKGGVNRILLATDGDFNVGISDTEQLKGFVERKRENGVMLSVLGFGRGNYRDELSQALAQNGNGVAAYIDSLSEAQKVLVQESSGTLFTIA